MRNGIRHIITNSILIFVCVVASFGQTVSIPDTNFRNFLKGTSFPGIIDSNGNLVLAEAGKFGRIVNGSRLPIKSIEGIQYFINATGLSFSNDSLTTIPNISKLTNLQAINWNYNNLVALPELSSFKRLKSLVAHDNNLTSLPDISKNDSLTELNLNTNLLKTVPDLSNLVRLQKLSLHNNQFSKLTGVENLDSLQEFTCYNNQVGNFPLLDQLVKIQSFDASKNQLTSAPDFGKNSGVQTIRLHQNLITSLPDYTSYKNLKQVTLYQNKLSFKELLKILPINGHDSIFQIFPQQTFNIGKPLLLTEGQAFTLSTGIDTSVTNISYCWYKNGQLQDSVTKDKWTVPYVSLKDSGQYSARIKHPAFTNFYLQTDAFAVNVQPCVDISAVSTAVTEINCQNTGTLEVNYPATNVVYELKSLITGKVFTSTTGKISGLTEPSYILSLKTLTGCSKSYPKEIKIPTQKCKDYLITPDNDGNADTFFFEASGKVEIYDKRGNIVKRLTIPSEWDCTSDKGKVASGYYIANINDGESQIGLSVVYL
jgi:hypothetical protein